MKAVVSIIMGSTSDWPVMKKAADFFESMEIPFEVNALSAHRTPDEVEKFATTQVHFHKRTDKASTKSARKVLLT